jgi:hypothetical protein
MAQSEGKSHDEAVHESWGVAVQGCARLCSLEGPDHKAVQMLCKAVQCCAKAVHGSASLVQHPNLEVQKSRDHLVTCMRRDTNVTCD